MQRRGGGQEAPLHLVGHGQLALHRLVAHGRLVQLGVLHGERRLAGHAHQHVQIVLLEAVPRVERVDLDHAQRLAVAVDQRRAHHRADVEVDDALGHVETGVGGGVGREDRLFARHHVVDDRAADADALPRPRGGDT